MKRKLCCILCALLISTCFVGCETSKDATVIVEDETTISESTTTSDNTETPNENNTPTQTTDNSNTKSFIEVDDDDYGNHGDMTKKLTPNVDDAKIEEFIVNGKTFSLNDSDLQKHFESKGMSIASVDTGVYKFSGTRHQITTGDTTISDIYLEINNDTKEVSAIQFSDEAKDINCYNGLKTGMLYEDAKSLLSGSYYTEGTFSISHIFKSKEYTLIIEFDKPFSSDDGEECILEDITIIKNSSMTRW